MSVETVLGLWSDSMAVSLAVWLVLLVLVLYAGRRWIEPFACALFQGADRVLRFSGRAVRAAARQLNGRQCAYLRSLERERLDNRLYRELNGLHDRVNRDLGGYPVLQRTMHEQIQRLEQDYHSAEDVPPAEPAWLRTVADLSRNPPQGDAAVARVLEDIHDGLQRAGRAAQDEYQSASRKRLELLRAMLPAWRELGDRLRAVEVAIQGVVSRSREVDELMARREALAEGGPEMDAGLAAGSVGRMLISLGLLGLAALAAVVSFHLIERPLAEAVGVAHQVGPWPLSALTSGLLILLAPAAGLLVTETRRMTSLVPGLGTVDLGTRRRLARLGLVVLLVVALLQAALAFSRDLFMAHDEVLALSMTLEPQLSGPVMYWIPALAQMVMALVLPLLLAITALPLESFLRHGGAVLGAVVALLLHLLGFLLALTARVLRWGARLLLLVYGLVVFVPVKIEEQVRQRVNGREPKAGEV